MLFDSRGDDAEVPGAEYSAPGADAVRGDGGAAGAERGARSDIAITAGAEELLVGGADVEQVRTALAELGACGSRSLDGLTPVETIALLDGLQGLSGAIAAVQARALVHLEAAVKQDCRDRGETAKQALKVARAEASAALKTSKSASGQSMSSCRRLVQSMPGMLSALAHGRIVAASGHQIGRAMAPASPSQREQVDEILTGHLGYLEGAGPEDWGDEAERVLHSLDPGGAADRHEVARRERNVTVRRGRHGMATITAHVTGLDGARIRKGLSLAAEKARAGGDRRGHQQIMADRFVDALIGRGDGIDPSTLEIGVLVTDRSLLAPAHADAATVEGYGSVPYEHIRLEMLGALEAEEDPELALTMRKVFLDHDDGQLVAVESRSRQFPPALARLLRYAHQSCRAPYCDASIRQLDHIVPWSEGGQTSFDNGNGLCAADNQKEQAGQTARVITDEDGVRRTVEWTTRYGQKARRGGINFDPVGTARRRRHHEKQPTAPENEIRTATAPPGAERPPGRVSDEVGASLERAIAHLDLESAARRASHITDTLTGRSRHWLRRRRFNCIFLPHLIVIDGHGAS